MNMALIIGASTANHREVKYKELRAKETKLKKMVELIKQKEKAAQEVNNNRTKLEGTFSCRDGFTASLFFLYSHGLTCITHWFSIYIFHTMNMALIITYYAYVAFDSCHKSHHKPQYEQMRMQWQASLMTLTVQQIIEK
jgi:hypothetical protein